jgi:MFS family permease
VETGGEVLGAERESVAFRSMLWLVATAAFMQMLDTTIVNTALPAMAVSLGESPLRMQAVAASYALAVAMVIPASGWLADRFGTRGVFVAAVVLFSLGSLACAASRGLTQLVAARVLQGVGGAMLLPVGRLVVLRVVPRAPSNRSFRWPCSGSTRSASGSSVICSPASVAAGCRISFRC